MSAHAKVEKFRALKLGYLRVAALTIRHTTSPLGELSQSLTLELLNGQQIVAIRFAGLRQLRLANLDPSSHCLLNIVSIVRDQWEDIQYQVFNEEQDFTLTFYCADFDISEREAPDLAL